MAIPRQPSKAGMRAGMRFIVGSCFTASSYPSHSLRKLVVALLGDLSSVGLEPRNTDQSHLVADKAEGGSQHAQPISHAALEVDRRSLLEVLRWAGDLPNAESKVH